MLPPPRVFRNGGTASGPISTDVRPRARAARRSFLFAPRIRNSWRSCFAQEVPEIYDGNRRGEGGSPRDPGSAAPKIAVISRDFLGSIRSVPASACAGSRVQAVVNEPSRGEKIDIHPVVARHRRPSWSTRWRPPRSPRSCSTRTRSASRSWSRPAAFARDRPGAGQNVRLASQPHRLGTSTILTEQEESEAPSGRLRAAHPRCSWMRSTSTRVGRPAARPPKASRRSRRLAAVEAKEISSIEGLRRGRRPAELQTRADRLSGPDRGGIRREAQGAARRRRRAQGDPRRDHADAGRAWARNDVKRRSRTWQGLAPRTTSPDGPSAKGRRDDAQCRLPSTASTSPREECEAIVMQGPASRRAGSPRPTFAPPPAEAAAEAGGRPAAPAE